MWYEIIGGILGFAGSVIFSAGLIKSSQQIKDENSTYFDSNPFTLEAELNSRPYFIVAFGLIIAGFSATLGGNIGVMTEQLGTSVPLLLTIAFTLAGYLAAILFYIHQAKQHQAREIRRLKKLFKSSLISYANMVRGYVGKSNEVALFESQKEAAQTDLAKKADAIGDGNNTAELAAFQALGNIDSAERYADLAEKLYGSVN